MESPSERKNGLALIVGNASSRPDRPGNDREWLDRADPVPLYHQLYRILLERIETGEWKPGDLIPSEKELGEQFKLSRITIRQTLQHLAADGYLSRQQGRGTFV